MRRGIHAVVVLALAASCSRLDGLSGGADGADAGEAGPPPPSDAGSDATPERDTGADVVDAGPPSCPADAIFCEDFENPLAAWPSLDEEQGATCRISQERAHSGAASLTGFAPFRAGVSGSQDQCYVGRTIPAKTSGQLALRAYVWIEAAGQTGGTIFPWFRALDAGSGCANDNLVWAVADASWKVSDIATNDAVGSAAVPFATWTCVELIADVASPSHVKLLVDDVPILDRDFSFGPSPFCGFDTLDLGITGHASSGDVTIYWDDVVLAPHPVGCK